MGRNGETWGRIGKNVEKWGRIGKNGEHMGNKWGTYTRRVFVVVAPMNKNSHLISVAIQEIGTDHRPRIPAERGKRENQKNK